MLEPRLLDVLLRYMGFWSSPEQLTKIVVPKRVEVQPVGGHTCQFTLSVFHFRNEAEPWGFLGEQVACQHEGQSGKKATKSHVNSVWSKGRHKESLTISQGLRFTKPKPRFTPKRTPTLSSLMKLPTDALPEVSTVLYWGPRKKSTAYPSDKR